MKRRQSKICALRPAGFTLVELMVSMVVLSMILLVSVQVLNQTQKTWRQGVTRLEQFREARAAFESITTTLRQAALNTYLTYQYHDGDNPTVPANKDQVPLKYVRQSELQFLTGQAVNLISGVPAGILVTHGLFFQARLGVSDRDGYEALNKLLCGRGYFIMRSDDDAYRPAPVAQRRTRYRLWEFRPPAEENTIYTDGTAPWYANAVKDAIQPSESMDKPSQSRPVAENIIALIISPQVTPDDVTATGKKTTWIAPDYAYDSTAQTNASSSNLQGTQHMLPPVVVVTLVAIDEASAKKLEDKYQGASPQLVPQGAFLHCDNMEADLQALEGKLLSEKLNYRVFSAAIALRNSKWGLLR